MLAFDTAREVRIAQKKAQTMNTDQIFYELEVERIYFSGNMTSVLLMLASSIDALTRFCVLPSFLEFWLILKVLVFSGIFLHSSYFGYVLDNLRNPPLLSFLVARLFLCSQGPLALDIERHLLRLYVASCCHLLVENDNLLGFDLISGLY